ncbi:sialidase family protein [Streptomyces radicis]|uniref:exo-alpha-sialidase n=1 Tax=Streptomyces radicis TaxID=1750517 RepID=A0A3A9VVN8_9ACTN|nr:sialidase family protein [Streptomyces radicis]RKN04839.1 exo-alpha-sialidase [Streptomyces radicis]RKN25349.1 exo-alpha-sialidase [Streptomyces radicis]
MPVQEYRRRRRTPALSWFAILTTVAWAVLSTAPASGAGSPPEPPASPEPAISTPFAHHDEGYACYRIPALVTTPRGTLLAFAEARVTDCSDVGNIDLVVKRSTDGGRTWDAMTVLRGKGTRGGYGNPVPVVDEVSGRVSLLYAYNAWTSEDGERRRGSRSLHSMYSGDDGLTWTPGGVLGPLKPVDWTWVSFGPGHGVQLRRGAHAGRLIVPGDHDTADGRSGAQLYYSDDGGMTWHLGAVYDVPDDEPHPGELTVVELVDGSLYVNARTTDLDSTSHYRLAGHSADGGLTFTREGFAPVAGLAAPPVSASLLRLRATDEGDPRNRLLLSAPARPVPQIATRRRTMTIRTSYDEGRTWQSTASSINFARAGYSDLTELITGEIGLLYETGGKSPHGTVKFTAFTVASLDGGVPRHDFCPAPRPSGGSSFWGAADRGPGVVRAAATVNRRTPSTLPRSSPIRRPPPG